MPIDFNLLKQLLPGASGNSTLSMALQTRASQTNALQQAIAAEQADRNAVANYALQSKRINASQNQAQQAQQLEAQKFGVGADFQQQQLSEQQRQFDIKTDMTQAFKLADAETKAGKEQKTLMFDQAMASGNRAIMYALDPGKTLKLEQTAKSAELKERNYASGVRKEFLKNSQPYIDVADSYSRINQMRKVLLDPNNPDKTAADTALIYGIAKMYDPGGRVTDGDFDTIAGNKAIPDQIKILAKRLTTGDSLGPRQRKMLLQMADLMYKSSDIGFKHMQSKYQDIVENPTALSSITPDLRNPYENKDSRLTKIENRIDALRSKL